MPFPVKRVGHGGPLSHRRVAHKTRTGICTALLTGLIAGCSPAPTPAPQQATIGAPRRIVSMNPCVDATLMAIADPGQIAAISHYSHDPRATSIPIAQARRFTAVSDSADDIIAARPDLVIAGPHVAVQTVAALKRLGIPLMTVGVPSSLAENSQQISDIAARIGRVAQGAALNRKIEQAMTRNAAPPGASAIPALIWQSGGLVPGEGTLADEMMQRTGFHNISRDLGLKQWDSVGLESLLLHPPAVLLTSTARMGSGAGDTQANRMLTHPALKAAGRHIAIADYPSSLLHCGGPVVIRASKRLAEIRSELRTRRLIEPSTLADADKQSRRQ